jgi:hypothetical protein
MPVRSGVEKGLLLLGLLLLSGCATGRSGARESVGEGGAGGFPEQRVDAFQEVLTASGLDAATSHPVGEALSVERAHGLLEQLARASITSRSFAPRRALSWLLREALSGGERVDYAELEWRAERFGSLVVLRPDGSWAEALTGRALQRAGPPRLVGGEWRVGALRVGDFYFSRGGVFFPVNEGLRRVEGPPVAELGLGRDPLNAALDGAQQAMEELVVGLAESIRQPIRTLEGLSTCPWSGMWPSRSSRTSFGRSSRKMDGTT